MISEAEYTFRLRKRIVPLRLQPDYYPDGWLGALAGSKLVIDCSLPSKFEESVRNLVKELGNVGKLGAAGYCYSAVATTATATTTNNNNSHYKVHGAVIVNKVIARVHPVHLMNVD